MMQDQGQLDPQSAAIVQAIVSAIQTTDVWQFLQQQLGESKYDDLYPDDSEY